MMLRAAGRALRPNAIAAIASESVRALATDKCRPGSSYRNTTCSHRHCIDQTMFCSTWPKMFFFGHLLHIALFLTVSQNVLARNVRRIETPSRVWSSAGNPVDSFFRHDKRQAAPSSTPTLYAAEGESQR